MYIGEELVHRRDHAIDTPHTGINIAQFINTLKWKHDSRISAKILHHINIVEPIRIEALLVQ